MDGTSLTPQQEKLDALQKVLPEAFSEGKIDWEKLKATLGGDVNFANERYVLNWAGKSEAFKVLQTPTTKTLIPIPEESVKKDGSKYDKSESFIIQESSNLKNPNADNIFIEGENLEVLKVLQKSYFGKVKMIYIDPPYNTGNDSFVYPDKFGETKASYEKRVGDKDEEGYLTKDGIFRKNSKENGQYHSNWLNMMMPRLYLAKNLLRQDGVIFVSIDDNEVHNLRLLMNEIFGEENFVASIVWQKKYAATNDSKGFSTTHDYIVVFQKSESFNRNLLPRTEEVNKPYKNDDGDSKGLWRSDNLLVKSFSKTAVYPIVNPNTAEEFYPAEGSSWRANQETMNKWLSENRIYFGKDGKGAPQLKRYLNEVQQGVVPITWWAFNEVGHNDEASKEVSSLFESKTPFDTPKPTRLIGQMMKIGCNPNDIILDFFAGSGTTAHAVMDLNAADGGNRKYICVQLPELTDEKSEAYKAGYKTIADISKERIRRAGKKINDEIEKEITNLELRITKLYGELPTQETIAEIDNLKSKIKNLQSQDLGFKVLKLEDSNFKQWQQFPSAGGVSEGRGGKEAQANALAEQIKLFVDPVSESATIENMVYELLLKSGKDLNSPIAKKSGYHAINGDELVLLLEQATQEIIDTVIAQKPNKVIALDKLFKGNDQLKTNTVLQMRDAGIAFKTI